MFSEVGFKGFAADIVKGDDLCLIFEVGALVEVGIDSSFHGFL